MQEEVILSPPEKEVAAASPGFFEKLSNWELWPSWALYAPLAPVWIYYVIRSRSVWFFTNSNPTIPFGGYEGEGKYEVYQQMPADCYPRTVLVKAGEDFNEVIKRVREAGFEYPFAVKPDVGRKGLMFRKIDQESQLKAYHDYFPYDYLVQDLVELPIEYGIFYVRYPSSRQGVITGVFMRESMEVFGDGLTPLKELILRHPYASKKADHWLKKHADLLDWIPADREKFVISYAINRSRGARLRNVSHEADETLARFFDRISLHQGNFFWGRYDVKCSSLAELKEGKNYYILEYNGAGASPSQIYHDGKTIFEAYRVILDHWRMMFEISVWNRKQAGIKYWPFLKGWRFLQKVNKYLDELERYDIGI